MNPASANLITHGNVNRKQFKGGNSASSHQSSNSQPIYYRNNNRRRNHNQQGLNLGGRFAKMPDKIGEESTQIKHNAKSVENLFTQLSTIGIGLIKIFNLLAPTTSLLYLLCLPPLPQCPLTLHGILSQEPQITLHQILTI